MILVGKSAYVQRFVKNVFLKEYVPTVEGVLYNKHCKIDNANVSLQIMDTSGMNIINY